MKNLFITTHGLKLSKSGSYLVVKGKDVNEKIPLGAFSNVFILSNVSITTQVLKFLARNGKYVFIINTAGKLQSIILPEIVTSVTGNRARQYKKFEDERMRVYLSQELLLRKALLTQRFLKKFREAQGLDPQTHPYYRDFYKDVSGFIESARSIEQLRGIDGFIMRTLYNEFASSIEKFFSFKNRSYHPPEDEVNAVLSLVFSMFYSLLFPLIISYDLDPYVGFFHIKKGKHAILSSDLMELARPELIFFTADILNRGYFDQSDFKKFRSGIFLKPKATQVLCKLFMEKILFSDIFFPVEAFIKERILK